MKLIVFIYFINNVSILFSQQQMSSDTTALRVDFEEKYAKKDVFGAYESGVKLAEIFNGSDRRFVKSINIYDQLGLLATELRNDSIYYLSQGAKAYTYFRSEDYHVTDSLTSILLAETNLPKLVRADCLFMQGKIAEFDGNYEAAKKYLIEAVQLYKAGERIESLAIVWRGLGNIAKNQGLPSQAIEYYLQGIEDLKKSKMGAYLSINMYNSISNLAYRIENYNLALEYSQKILDAKELINHEVYYQIYRCNHARILFDMGQTDMAEKMYLEAYDSFVTQDANNYKPWALKGLLQLAVLRNDKTEIETLIDSIEMYYQLASTNELKFDLRKEQWKYFAKNQKWDKLYTSLIQTKAEIITDESLRERAIFHENLHQFYKAKGRYKEALFEKNQQQELQDSLSKIDRIRNTNDLEAKYQRKEQQSQIALLNSENQNKSLQLLASNRRNIGLAIGLGLLVVFLIILTRFYKKIQTQNAMIEKSLKEKDTLLREIHHRVKNNLQFVSSLLNLQSRHVQDDTALKVLKEGQNRVKSMALIHQNLYQEDNLVGINVQEYFRKLSRNLFDSYNISPERIQLKMNIEKIHLDVDTVIPLGLVVNELISNALKHAFPNDNVGVIQVSLKEEGDTLCLNVSDDGVGMTDEEYDLSKKSFGYRLINAFGTQLNGDINIDRIDGTSVSMLIKDYAHAS